MKKILITCFMCLCLISFQKLNVNAYNQEVLQIDYDVNSEFRAVWVSPLVADVSSFASINSMKSQINSVLDNMDKYNLNVLIFHVRIYNDALYVSDYNKKSNYYNIPNNYDALPWIIDECHKRGIEFHAWLNPYRVSTSVSSSLENIAKGFPAHNPANNPDNLLKGKSTIILNPGIPEVQSFLVSTVMEIVNKYKVDAIHFDDYFYIDGIDDSKTYQTYGSNQGNDQFRRDSVDALIKNLSESIKKFNNENDTSVQLGISPTPVWYTGNGVVTYDENGNAITNGSATGPAELHYGAPLFCDTLKWVNEEWIDYILPQCYLGISNNDKVFKEAIDWWNKVVEHKKTKLYIGIGLYRAEDTSKNPDWKSANELKNEFEYMETMSNVEGFAIFSYKHMLKTYASSYLKNASEYFENKALVPEHSLYLKEKPNPIANTFLESLGVTNKITITSDPNIRYVVLVKEVNGVFSLVDIGLPKYFLDDEENSATYYVANVGKDNQLSDYVKLSDKGTYYIYTFKDIDGKDDFQTGYIEKEDFVLPSPREVYGYKFIEWEQIDEFTYLPIYEELFYDVTYTIGGEVYKVERVKHGEKAPEISVEEGYHFTGWRNLPTSVTSDITVSGTGYKMEYKIFYYDGDTLYFTHTFFYKDEVNLTLKVSKTGFSGWLLDGKLVTEITMPASDVTLYAYFDDGVYDITYDLQGGTCDHLVLTFNKNEKIIFPHPVKEGFVFMGWYEDGERVTKLSNKDYHLTAMWGSGYVLNYDPNGGRMDETVVIFGLPETIVLQTPTRKGYRFLGWYEDGEKVTFLSDRDYNLTAEWEEVEGCNYSMVIFEVLTLLGIVLIFRRKII